MKNTAGALFLLGPGAIVLMMLGITALALFSFREIELEHERVGESALAVLLLSSQLERSSARNGHYGPALAMAGTQRARQSLLDEISEQADLMAGFAGQVEEILAGAGLNVDADITALNTEQQELVNNLRELAALVGARIDVTHRFEQALLETAEVCTRIRAAVAAPPDDPARQAAVSSAALSIVEVNTALFDLHRQEIALRRSQTDLLGRNRELVTQLARTTEQVSRAIQGQIQGDKHRLADTLASRSRQLLFLASLFTGASVFIVFYTRRRLIRRAAGTSPQAWQQPTPLAVPAHAAPAHLAEFNWELGLAHVAGEVRLFRRLLRDFVARAPDYESRLGAASAGDAATAEAAAHNLKGVAGNLGAEALCAAADVLERRLREHGAVSADTALADTLERLAAAVHTIQTTLARMPQTGYPSAAPADRLALREELLDLAQLLRDGDAAARDRLDELWVHLDAFVPEESERLEQQIMNYDFDEAYQTVQQITQRLLQSEPEEGRP